MDFGDGVLLSISPSALSCCWTQDRRPALLELWLAAPTRSIAWPASVQYDGCRGRRLLVAE